MCIRDRPCTEAIIRNNIKKVVISINDPNEKVDSISTAYLKNQGVEVISGVLPEEGSRVIAPFKAHLNQRPYIILKWAQSSDGYIGKRGKQVWLSNKLSKIKSHQWRTEVNGILVGHNTVLVDNPILNARLVKGDNPLRIILTNEISPLKTKQVWTDERPALFLGDIESASHNKKECCHMPLGNVLDLLDLLFEKEINHLLVEGGFKTIMKFINAGLWDECRIIKTLAPLLSGIKAPQVRGELYYSETLDSDVIQYITNNKKC